MTVTAEKPRVFWRSSGLHLLERDDAGRLVPTADYLRAYLTRPEVHPVEESCEAEHRLFEALMADPFRAVADAEIDAIRDPDARAAYTIVLRFRDALTDHGTLEGAYMALATGGGLDLPPVFLDQMVHVILANILRDGADPLRLRAAELFFRDQNVNVDDGRMMLADDEIVSMYAETGGGLGGLGQLLAESATPARQVELDVLDEDNAALYWERSDRFDTVVDFRFSLPALDAFCRVMELWVSHFLGLQARIQPMQSIRDERWSWHVGLDAEATRILNALYNGDDIAFEETQRLVALFQMEIRDRGSVIDSMKGKPVYLGLAMTPGRKIRMKPQNLLVNLPLRQEKPS